MNNQFLRHLQSLTPQGKAAEKKIFIPADQFKAKEPEKINMEPEIDELDEATRSKYIKAYRKHKVGTDTTKLDIEDAKRNAAVLRRGGADDETIRQGSFSGNVPMSQYNKVNMAKYRFGNKAERSKEDGKKSPRNVNEDMELDEGYQAKRMRIIRKYGRKQLGSGSLLSPKLDDFMKRSFKKKRQREERISGGKGSAKAMEISARKKKAAMQAKGLAESKQLDEAGYKRLMRLKKAAYTAQDKAYRSFTADQNKPAKLARAAAEREAQVAAGMARRGGASPEAVKGGGSRIGKSGKYTQKAGALANQRDKALAKFRSRAGYNKAQGMSRSSTEKQISRNVQQFQDDIRNRSRSGDFGQDNQAALRARSNFQKRFGRLKGK